MSVDSVLYEMPWFRDTLIQNRHVLLHRTDCDRALSILRSGSIRGCDFYTSAATEAYPHFVHALWPSVYNRLDVADEITLMFSCELPARYRGEGNNLPESGWLEIYSRGVDPWQCCIHPKSSPLTFVGASDWVPQLQWHDRFPFRRSLDAKLNAEIEQASREERLISAATAT